MTPAPNRQSCNSPAFNARKGVRGMGGDAMSAPFFLAIGHLNRHETFPPLVFFGGK